MLWREKVTEVMTQMQAFEPDLVLVSAGFDAHKSDNFGGGHMDLEAADYFWVADELAHRFPRIVSVLEGGYNIEVLSMLHEPYSRARAVKCRRITEMAR